MRKTAGLFSVFLFGLLFSPLVAAQDVNDFYFDSFSGEYFLDQTDAGYGRLSIKEEIIAVFPDFNQNHGILRAIPEKYRGESLNLEVASVTDENGSGYPYSTYSEFDNLVLKIGDPDIFVTGETTYNIAYSVENVVTFYDDHDELFWDINGDQWPQGFGSVTARFIIPSGIADKLLDDLRCFAGEFGTTLENCEIFTTESDEGTIIEARSEDLGPYQTLSVVMGFESGTFVENTWPKTRQIINYVIFVVIPSLGLTAAIRRWRKYGRDKGQTGVIVPQYVPPKDLNVMAAKTLVDERFKPNFLAAGIIELAIAGYIKITEQQVGKRNKSEYTLELLKDGNGLEPEQVTLLSDLFGTAGDVGATVNLSKQKNKLYSTVQSLSSDLPKRLVKTGYFRETPNMSRGKQIAFSVLIFIAGFVMLITIGENYWSVGAGLLAAAVIAFIFAFFMPAKTEKGTTAKEYILGVKDYIELAEKDRIKFLQSPEAVEHYGDPTKKASQIKLFESLLPLAMAFGLEKNWAKQFQGLYQQPPTWYASTQPFVAANFANSVSKFGTTSNSAFTAPTSSGSSGFSGGGFSGGGGGGGGGGGW